MDEISWCNHVREYSNQSKPQLHAHWQKREKLTHKGKTNQTK